MEECFDTVPIDPTVCTSECNLVNFGDFEGFTPSLNGYYPAFVSPYNQQIILSGSATENTVDILSGNNNQYLRFIASTQGSPENVLVPICRPVHPCTFAIGGDKSCGCSLTVAFKACANANDPQIQQIPLAIYGLTSLPNGLQLPANVPCDEILYDNSNTPIGLCLGQINVPTSCPQGNVVFPNDPISLSGTINVPINYIWIQNLNEGTAYSANVYLDDLSVIADCTQNTSVDADITSACPGDIAIVNYTVCNIAVAANSIDVTLKPDLTNSPGLTLFSYNPDFPGGIGIVEDLAPGECVNLTLYLQIDTKVNPNSNLSFSTFAIASDNCGHQYQFNREFFFTVDDCSSMGCNCPSGSIVIGTPGQETPISGLIPGTLPAMPTSPLNLTIQGTLVIDVASYDFPEGSKICMTPGAEIKVGMMNQLNIKQTHVRGCEERWKSITVELDGKLTISRSIIEDGQYAVHPLPRAKIELSGNAFRRNYISLYYNDPSGFFFLDQYSGNRVDGYLPLKPHYDPNDPNDGTWSYAGIYTIGQDILDIVSFGAYSTNYFVNLRNGIITIGAHLTVRGAQFIDILDMNEYGFLEGYGIWAQAVNGSRRLTVQGFGETGTPSFQNCTIGILSCGMAVDGIRNNNMLQMGIGVRSLFARNRMNVFSNSIEANILGIGTSGINPMTLMNVSGNTVDLIASGAIGIQMTGEGTTPAAGFIFGSNSNQVNLHEPDQQGIGVLTLNQVRIRNNTVQAFGNGTSMTGLNLQGSHDNILQCNDITGLDPTSGTAVRAWDAENTAWRCNKIGNTENGVYVLMGGHSPDNFIGTSIGNHTWGLRIDGNPTNPGVLGQQHHTGNRWIGNYTGAGARHESNVSTEVQKSKFTVHTTTPPYHPPSVSVEPGVLQTHFFDPESGTPNTFCLSLNACPVDEFTGEDPQIHDIDLDIAGGTTGSPESRYLAERYLYRKLLRNPQLVQAGSVLDSFYNQKSNEPVGMLVQMEQALAALFVPAPADSAELAANDAAIADSLAQVMLLDSLIAQSSGQDSLDLLDQRLATLQALDSLTQVQDSLLDLIQTARTVEAAQLAAQNAAIPASYLFEVNEQTVNDIFLNTIASGVYSFDSLQQATLETIAYQCPLTGGTAVFRARGLLSLVGDYDFGDDVVNCQEVRNRSADGSSANEMEESSLLIYPNPASTEITVVLPNGSNGDYSRLQLLDVSGMVVREVQTPEQTSLRMDVSELPRGIYLCKVHRRNVPPLIAKFVLLK